MKNLTSAEALALSLSEMETLFDNEGRIAVTVDVEYVGGEPNNGYDAEIIDLKERLDSHLCQTGAEFTGEAGINDDGSEWWLYSRTA